MPPLNLEQAIEKFSNLAGEEIRSVDERVLIVNFSNYLRLLQHNRLDVVGAKHLLRLIRTTLKSETIKSVRANHNYLFCKSIDTGKAILQKVYSLKTGKYLCAKVFLNIGDCVGAVSEFNISKELGSHENIAAIEDSIEFSHVSDSKPLMALMMPLYSGSLDELLVCSRDVPFPLSFFKQIAHGLLAAAARFQEKSYSHCDIKPSNVMIDGYVPVVIDFGAVVNLGSHTVEHTPGYALDASHDAVTSEFDLNCIVTTMVRCFAPAFILQERTKAEMIALIGEVCHTNSNLNDYGNICLALLQCASASDALQSIQWESDV